MNKTLTEKWKDGELKEGEYYCKITESPYIERVHLPCLGDSEFVIEVLSPVLTYDEYKDIEKGYIEICHECRRLQEQLKEANELIKAYATPIEVLRKTEGNLIITETKLYYDPIKSQEYLNKWGVK